MTIELDHFFILTGPGAPQAELLSEIGLIEGTPNDHPGQGTANRRFFFADSMLELAYVQDINEAVNGPGSRLRIAERAANAGTSPFGIVVRASQELVLEPFPGWCYRPDYLENGEYFHIGENSGLLEEPLCIYVPFKFPAATAQPLPADPFTSVTEIGISVPVSQPSVVLETLAQCERISLRLNEPHRLEIVFNQGKQGNSRDLRPDLPLIIRW
jgi:hypothetical protein